MWFIGLIAGALIGSALGGGAAMIGAGLGAVAGALYGSRPNGEDSDARFSSIEDSIRQLSERIKLLEENAVAQPPTAGYVEPVASEQISATSGAVTSPVVAAIPVDTGNLLPVQPSQSNPKTESMPASQVTADVMASWWDRLLDGNLVAKAGVVILFLGVGFLLKYAYDNALLPVPVRLAGVALAGAGLFITGWRLLEERRTYGLVVQGGGIGLLYLDVFFTLKVYSFITPELGFALFMALGVVTTLLAVKQDAAVLAVLGLSGAFMAPVLAGSNTGSHVMLFSYYLLLNIFILGVSWFKSWRALNLVGFVFTFLVGLIWGWQNYRPELFMSVEPFLISFFLIYLAIPVLFAHRQPPHLRGIVEASLVFGMPLSAAAMQAGLVRDFEYGLAWSAAGAAVIYAALAMALWRREQMRVLSESHIALALILGSLAVAFAFDAYPTFAFWTLEGAALVWIGLRQERLLMRLFGLLLQGGGALMFIVNYGQYDLANPWFNDFVVGCVLIAVSSLLSSGLMHHKRSILIQGGETTAVVLLLWGLAWWFIGGFHVLQHALPQDTWPTSGLIFVAISVIAAEFIGAQLKWHELRRLQPLLPVMMLVVAFYQIERNLHPFAILGWLAWPLALAALYGVMKCQESDSEKVSVLPEAQHVAALLGAACLVSWEITWQLNVAGLGGDFPLAIWGLVPSLMVIGICHCGFEGVWPLSSYPRVYREIGLGVLSLWCVLWGLYAMTHEVQVELMPYFPLLNVIDLTQILSLIAVAQWLSVRSLDSDPPTRLLRTVLGGLAFLTLNVIVMRAVHHWGGVEYTLNAMAHSVLVQAALTLMWTTAALFLMVWARRAQLRAAWFGGAVLLAVVIAKLFMFDLSGSGTVERIVTFIGVGIGLLAIGYFAPVPPGNAAVDAGATEG